MRLPRPRWPQLSDSQVTTLVLAVGVFICIVIAALRFGLVVGLLTLNAVAPMLILERTRLFRIGRRHDRELAEIRGWLDAFRDWAESDTATQPIGMPAPEGPTTQPADVVLIGKWAEDMPKLQGPAARANAQDIEEQIQAIRARSAQRQAAKVPVGEDVA